MAVTPRVDTLDWIASFPNWNILFSMPRNTDMENPPESKAMGAYAGIIGYIDLARSGLYKAQENQQST